MNSIKNCSRRFYFSSTVYSEVLDPQVHSLFFSFFLSFVQMTSHTILKCNLHITCIAGSFQPELPGKLRLNAPRQL